MKNKKKTAVPVTQGAADTAAQKQRRRRPRRIIFGTMFVLSIIFIMISVTMAWFVYSNSAKVEGLRIDVTLVDNLLFDDGAQNKVVEFDGELHSITGNGKSFFKPVFAPEESGTPVQNGEFTVYPNKFSGIAPIESDAELSQKAFVYDFSLSIEGKIKLTLGEGTEIKAGDGALAHTVGAMRVAILEQDEQGEYQVKAIWIPDVTSTASGTPAFESGATFVGADKTEERVIFSTEQGNVTQNGVNYVWGAIDADNRMEIGELQGTGKYRFVLWVDGNDRECSEDILGESVSLTLKFVPAE